MKLTINLYSALERRPADKTDQTAAQRDEKVVSWTANINHYITTYLPAGFVFEIIDERHHAEWLWLSLTELGHQSKDDKAILDWLYYGLPDLLGFFPKHEVKGHKFTGEMGRVGDAHEN